MKLTKTIPAYYVCLLKLRLRISQKLCSVLHPTVISPNVIEIHLMKVFILRGELSLVRIYK